MSGKSRKRPPRQRAAAGDRETLRLVEPYARRPDPDLDVLVAQGVALAGTGRPREALAAIERVRQIDPTNVMALVNIVTVHLIAGDLDRAQQAFEVSLDLDPGTARAHNSLGVVAAPPREDGRGGALRAGSADCARGA